MKTTPPRLRAHHLFCLLSFSGEGYSDEFVEKFAELAEHYRNPDTLIEVLDHPDDACAACPHLSPDDGCFSPRDGPEQEVQRLGRKLLSLLNIQPGTHRSVAIHERIASVRLEDLHDACNLCSWYGETDCQENIARWVAGK